MANNDPSATPQQQQQQPGQAAPSFPFAVVRPNERKRQQLLNGAEVEARAYEEYKQARSQQQQLSISMPPRRLGGDVQEGACSLLEARLRQQHLLSTAKIRSANKAREAREKAKEEEDEKWRVKKLEARRKAERNEEKKVELEKERLVFVRQSRSQFFDDSATSSSASRPAPASAGVLRLQTDPVFDAARAAERARAIRAEAREKEEEQLAKKKEEARQQADRNEQKTQEKEKVDVADLRAKRLQAMGL